MQENENPQINPSCVHSQNKNTPIEDSWTQTRASHSLRARFHPKRLANIQLNRQIIRRQRCAEIRQTLTVIDARVPRDLEGDDPTRVLRIITHYQLENSDVVDFRGHGDGIVAWFQDEIVQVGLAHWLTGDGKVEG